MNSKNPLKVAVLLSGNGSNLQAIIDYSQTPNCAYEVALVISNRPNAYGLTRAKEAGIATQIIDHTRYESREEFDQSMQKILDLQQIQLVVLAGFMRILTAEFTEHFIGRMINIHPSLLPKYQCLNTHQRAIDAGDDEHGLSIHFVTPELDGGPVIAQSKTAIMENDNAETLQNRIHTLEHLAYPQVVDWIAQERLSLSNNEIIFDGGSITTPIVL